MLRDIAFEAAGGRVFGICGGTASGKSALLDALAGRGKTAGGTITLDTVDLTKQPARNRPVSFLTRPKKSVRAAVFGDARDKDSSGERQLDAFERLTANAERVLLLDEPFSHLDADLRASCFAAVRRAARSRDRVVIIASSDFDQIAAVADDAAVLAGGEIRQIGTPQEIYENPETVDVARATGKCNFFAARRLTSSDADLPEFHTIGGGHRLYVQKQGKHVLGAINQNMTLAIRPEQVSMSLGSSFPEDNLLRAVVTSIRFLGPTSLIEFDAAGLKIETRVFKVVGLSLGDECMLGLPPHRIRILRD